MLAGNVPPAPLELCAATSSIASTNTFDALRSKRVSEQPSEGERKGTNGSFPCTVTTQTPSRPTGAAYGLSYVAVPNTVSQLSSVRSTVGFPHQGPGQLLVRRPRETLRRTSMRMRLKRTAVSVQQALDLGFVEPEDASQAKADGAIRCSLEERERAGMDSGCCSEC